MLKQTVFSVATLLLLAGCNGSKEEVVEPISETKEPTVEEVEEIKEESAFTYPLTGLKVDEAATNRPIAVTVNNHPKARPQSGLHKADIVYEMLAEGDVTRLVAVYQSTYPQLVGPVRSSRTYFIDIAKGFDSIYIAHGYSPDAKAILSSGEIDHLNGMQYDGTLFHRASDRQAPHNSYITFENILKGADKLGFETVAVPTPLTFSEEGTEGQNQQSFSVSYYNNSDFTSQYQFDSTTSSYSRYNKGTQLIDKESQEPITLSNIFVIETDHEVVDSVGRRDIDLTSGGSGYLFQNGFKLDVKWKNENGILIPYGEKGPLPFIPGQTWVHIVPSLSSVQMD
ncbi:lipoprotein YerB [Bacillus coahuilensis m2-6]|uniref:DUF3048 domain-containing protein n=1 Tax=Bacillus coahuilensis TaxID=408580 RepID=UPI0001850A32|nr:DUF3048 domain-containing protein [Bacillus coahuilensis]KUP09956.1 lipoprotein YerB [Bacillus coahuilensis m2-6]